MIEIAIQIYNLNKYVRSSVQFGKMFPSQNIDINDFEHTIKNNPNFIILVSDIADVLTRLFSQIYKFHISADSDSNGCIRETFNESTVAEPHSKQSDAIKLSNSS